MANSFAECGDGQGDSVTPESVSAAIWASNVQDGPGADGATYVITTAEALAVPYEDGVRIAFVAPSTNPSPGVYEDIFVLVNGLGAPLRSSTNDALAAGDVVANTVVEIVMSTGGIWVLASLSPQAGARAPGETLPQVLEGAASAGTAGAAAAAIDHQHGSAIVGVTDGSAAAAGEVGEYLETVVLLANAVALTTTANVEIATLELPPGDWEVSGGVVFDFDATTVCTMARACTNVTGAGMDTLKGINLKYPAGFVPGSGTVGRLGGPVRMVRSSSELAVTMALIVRADFSVAACRAFGIIFATRVR